MSDEEKGPEYYELVTASGARRIQFADVIHMITVMRLGPIEMAEKLQVSRPTERKIRQRALEWGGLASGTLRPSKAGRPAGGERKTKQIPPGDYQKAKVAQRMLAEGHSEKEVRRKLNVGYHRSQRLIQMASQAGIMASAVNPKMMAETVQASLDVMQEIVNANENLKGLSEWLTAKIDELQEDTSHDADYIPIRGGGEDDEGKEIVSVRPFHERQKNLIQAVDVLRKLQEAHLKAVKAQQQVLQDLFDLKQMAQAMQDMRAGIHDALIALSAGGHLDVSPDAAMSDITDAIQRRFMKRKGIA